MTPIAHVDCGACHACCHQLVVLTDDDDPALYETETLGFNQVLKRRGDGSCIHLDDGGGCAVWPNHPAVCRRFHCGLWWRTTTRGQRRGLARTGDRWTRQMLSEGRARA